MAIILSPPPTPPEGGPPNVPPTLTVTFYSQLAAHFSEVFDEIAAIVPRDAELDYDASFVSTHLNVPLKFLGTAVAAVEQVPELRNFGKLDINKAHDTLQLLDAFRPIRDKVTAFLRDIGNALDARFAALCVEALDTYDLAKSLNRDPSNATLAAWVDNMARDLGRRGARGPRPKNPDPVPPADTVPAPVPVSTIPAPERPNGWNG